MSWQNSDVITARQFTRASIEEVLKKAKEYDKTSKEKKTHTRLDGKILATLFYEPSTRTRLSFETAMLRLGGGIIGFADPQTSSFAKGETVHDTIKLVENCADAIVMRNKIEGAAAVAAEASSVPVINAGDGANQHPTQALVDLYTIEKEKKKLDGLTILFVGDLKYGRTVHSLSQALMHYNVTIQLYAPQALRLSPQAINELRTNVKVKELSSLDATEADVVYATRMQKERFPDEDEFKRVSYKITSETIKQMKADSILMHPLPRVDEITTDVDGLPNAKYFSQEANGVPVRMAILDLILRGD